MAQNGVTNYAEIQQNEIEALESIFMEDFKEEEMKTAAWNKRADRRFRLRLWPHSESSDHTDQPDIFATLSVTLPTAYPNQMPICEVAFGDAVSLKIQQSIRDLVPVKAKALVGNEAIFEIAELVQEQLDGALMAATHTNSLPALDEERVKRQAQAALQAETARNEQLKAQQQAQTQENEARSAAIGKELNAQKSSKIMFGNENGPDLPLSDFRDAIVFDNQMKTSAPSGVIVAFRTIRQPHHLSDGSATAVGITTPADRNMRSEKPLLLLKTCEVGRGWDEDELKSELSNTLEVDLQLLMRVQEHKNLLPVLGYQIQAMSLDSPKRIWSVQIVSDYLQRGSLKAAIQNTGPLQPKAFSNIMSQILDGMTYLHGKQVTHGRLSLENVLLDTDRTGGVVAKITDILYQADLHYLKNPHNTSFSSATSTYWTPPEFVASGAMKPSTAADVWQLGIMMLQMLFGLDVQSHHSGPLKIKEEEPNLNYQLENLLERVFKSDPSRRMICFEIRSHAFIRADLPPIDPEGSAISPFEQTDMAPFTPRARLDSAGQATQTIPGRYAQDFKEISRLGKGGFGQVFRAIHALDGSTYAVKKIVSGANNNFEDIHHEVSLLSRLYHPNIVRYVTSWLETAPADHEDSESGSGEDDTDDLKNRGSNLLTKSKSQKSRGLDFVSSNLIDSDTDSDDGSDSFSGEDRDREDDDLDNFVTFQEDSEQRSENLSESPSTPKLAPQTPERARRQSSAAQDRTTKIILYIQMEFCENQTLRDVIRNDISGRPDEYWRHTRQITAALAYIHGNGIIHRDLKPENVFVSGSSIRLGDFGLAKPQVKERQRGRSAKQVSSLTASIGTSVYIAPEVRSSGGGTYDEKADMYSLGVMFFEMCSTPGATIMERAHIMQDLRKEPLVLPDVFEQEDMALQKDIVCSLLVHRPVARLSTTNLLAKLPSETDEEVVNQRIEAALADKHDPLYAKILKWVFSRSGDSREAKHYTYDISQSQHFSSADEAFLLSTAKDQLVHVFRRHCAVESTRTTFVPNTDHWTETVKVVDESGQMLHLPYDLTLPAARLLAKNGKIAPCKSYTVGPVYRRSELLAQHPNTSIEIDFDIVSKDSLDPALREAEAMKVMDEVIDEIPALSAREMCFHVNHSDLLDAILRTCQIPADKMRAVKNIISRLGQRSFAQVRAELRGPELALLSTWIDDLARYDFRETPDTAIRRLKALIGNVDGLEPTFSHLRAVIKFTKMLRTKRKIYISPLSCHSAHFYTGSLMFQCLFDGRKKRTVICAGGRYDRLIREHASNRSISPCFAVGFQLSWEILVHALLKSKSKTNAAKHKDEATTVNRRGDALVFSNDDEILRKEGLSVLEELWNNDIRAELSIDADSVDTLAYRGEESSYDWIIHVKQDDRLRFRSMIRNDEDEIPRAELISHIRSEMRERDRDRKVSDRPRLHHAASEPGNESVKAQKVHVLHSQNKSKKSNRQVIVTEAQHHAAELTQGFLKGPIVAVELNNDLFEMMRGLRIDDSESWRKAIQQSDLNARAYMGQVWSELKEISTMSPGSTNAFLYNFRSKACMIYDLTKSG